MQRRVLIVEDDALMGDLIAKLLAAQDYQVEHARDAAEALRIARSFDPDAVVLDVDLGLGPDGFQVAEALLRETPGIAVMFLTNLPDARFSSHPSARVHEQAAYLRKNQLATSDELVQALDAALRERVDRAWRHDLTDVRPLAALTAQQLDVLRLVSEGQSNQSIAQLRGRSVRSVERILSRIFQQLGIASDHQNPRIEATRVYLRATMSGK